MEFRPDIVDRDKASSHRLIPGRIYSGQVKAVDSAGRITVYIGELGTTFNEVVPLGTRANDKYVAGDIVKCGFTDEFFREIIVYGSVTIKPAKFVLIDDYVAPDQIILSSQIFG